MVYLSQDEPENWFYTVEQTILGASLYKIVQTMQTSANLLQHVANSSAI